MRRKNIGRQITYAIVGYALCAVIVVPILVMLLGSFKTSGEALRFDLSLPERFMFSNYSFVFVNGKILLAFTNSLLITVSGCALTICASALCAFYVARSRSAPAKVVGKFFSIGLVAPFQIITTFALMKIMNLIGSYGGVILIYAAIQMPWSMYMFVQFIRSVPRDLDEAACTDGATPLTMFFRIVLPLLKPVTATTAIMVVINIWNDFMIPLYFFDSSRRWTLPLTVYNFYGQYFSDWNYVFADLTMVAFPVAVLYLYFQKYIIAGITAGAVKG